MPLEEPASVDARQETREPTRTSRLITEGLVLTAIPVLFYWYTYAYELGLAERYGFPGTWIALDLSAVLADAPILIFLIGVPALFVLAIPPAFVMLLLHPLALGILFWWAATSDPHGHRWLHWLAAISMATGLVLIWSSRLEGARKRAAAEPSSPPVSAAEWYRGYGLRVPAPFAHALGLHPRRDARLVFIAFLLVIGWMVPYNSGRWRAGSRRVYEVRAGSPELVLLRTYGDRAICATLDRSRATILREFAVIPLANDSGGMWRLEDLGNVTIRDLAPAKPPAAP
jgi:hypothetical protein